LREKPAGTIRITAADDTIKYAVWPRLAEFLPNFPDIKVELIADLGLANIVAERYDAGVRFGDQVAKDMISVPIGPDVRFAVVGSPAYFEQHPTPSTPQDLLQHNCINLRLPTYGGIYAWEFEKDGQELKVRVEGQVIFNSILQIRDACLAGFGLAHMPENLAEPYLATGQVARVLDDWCPFWSGLHLYYPSRRQSSPAFALFVDAMRYRPT
jgi:DNA-binding transcriptional LysR family regulator